MEGHLYLIEKGRSANKYKKKSHLYFYEIKKWINMNRLQSAGFTLIELMIVIAITAILTALAVPSFSVTLDNQRISGAAEAVLSDLRWARSEAIKRNTEVRVTFTSGSNWSYTIDTVPVLATNDGILPKTVYGSDFPSTELPTAFGNLLYTTFDPVRGTANNGTAKIESEHYSASADVIVSTLGRVRICGTLGGYAAC